MAGAAFFGKAKLDEAERARQIEISRSAQAARDLEAAQQQTQHAVAELERIKREEAQRDALKQQRKQEIDRLNAPRAVVPPLAEPPPPSYRPAQSNNPILQMIAASARGDDAAINESKAIAQGLPKPARGNKPLARALNAQGLELMKFMQFDQAAKQFKTAQAADAGDVEITNNLGYTLLKMGDYGAAKAALVAALALDPGRTNAWANLGQTLAEAGDINNAVACLDNAYRFSKNPQKTHMLFLRQLAGDENSQFKAALQQATQRAEGKLTAAPKL